VYTAIARYAERFHATVSGHHVASPLGAWLLLALCAAAGGPDRRDEFEALGVDPSEAAAVATGLLSVGHELVLSAAAAWTGADAPATTAPRLARDLPAAVATGPLPDHRGLDAWATEKTLGLIERFPVTVTRETLLVLATALATKVSWIEPFTTVPAAELRGVWALETALRSPSGYPHVSFIARTQRAGVVAVHSARAIDEAMTDGLMVTSVIAEPDVPAADVIAAGYEIARSLALRQGLSAKVSLFDLPLGDGPLWTITEQETRTTAPDGREERCASILPAWRATSDHDLGRDGLGFPAAARALAAMLGLDEYKFQARQAAVAAYSRTGFEAAAVSAMAVAAAGYIEPRVGVLRDAELRFGHPYAVVAVTTQQDGPWDGVPVFSVWVSEPEDADRE
jgi:hypothetical protein